MPRNLDEVWSNCLEIIKDIVEERHFKTWFEPIKAIELKNNVLVIQLPSLFFYEYVSEHFETLLTKTLQKILGKDAGLEYRFVLNNDENNLLTNPYIVPDATKMRKGTQLNPVYTFETFIEGDWNLDARRAGKSIAGKPGAVSSNPFVIYGVTGIGKTHLAQAIGNEVKLVHPEMEVLYVSSEKFIKQYDDHQRNNSIDEFIHFYQSADILILDDLQFFNRAEKAQDTLLVIFNHLHRSGKQLVFTSNKPPTDISGIEVRLRSRLCWGLSIEIQFADYDTRLKVFQRKLKKNGWEA